MEMMRFWFLRIGNHPVEIVNWFKDGAIVVKLEEGKPEFVPFEELRSEVHPARVDPRMSILPHG